MRGTRSGLAASGAGSAHLVRRLDCRLAGERQKSDRRSCGPGIEVGRSAQQPPVQAGTTAVLGERFQDPDDLTRADALPYADQRPDRLVRAAQGAVQHHDHPSPSHRPGETDHARSAGEYEGPRRSSEVGPSVAALPGLPRGGWSERPEHDRRSVEGKPPPSRQPGGARAPTSGRPLRCGNGGDGQGGQEDGGGEGAEAGQLTSNHRTRLAAGVAFGRGATLGWG